MEDLGDGPSRSRTYPGYVINVTADLQLTRHCACDLVSHHLRSAFHSVTLRGFAIPSFPCWTAPFRALRADLNPDDVKARG